MPQLRHPVSPIDPVTTGSGGVTGANSSLWPRNLPMHVVAMEMYGDTVPQGKAPGHNPAYGSVGNDGHWPGVAR